MNTPWTWVLLGPAIVAIVAIPLLRRTTWSRRLADLPNERSLHSEPTPRLGGLGILLAAIPFVTWQATGPIFIIVATALGLAVISFIDDLSSLPIEVRLPAHFTGAVVVVLLLHPGGPTGQAALLAVAAIFGIVWFTNLFNFMDGSDGLAGGMAVIGFGTLAFAARESEPALALCAAAIASACAGFLVHNFPPARVFMGDAGSIPIGFMAASFGYFGVVSDTWPAWFPVLVFSPFIMDATITLLRRLLRREKVWRAHRSHYYQRLVLSGWSRKRLALGSLALMFAAASSAVVALQGGEIVRWAIILVWAAIYALLVFAIDRRAPTRGAA